MTDIAVLGFAPRVLSKDLVAASTIPLVLSLLSESESYGYELIQRVKELSDGKIQWSEGMLYPVLHWLEQQQWIESEWRAGESGRQRKYYRVRAPGRKALRDEREQWMTVHHALAKLWNHQPHSI